MANPRDIFADLQLWRQNALGMRLVGKFTTDLVSGHTDFASIITLEKSFSS
jgi:hypothetical protein